MKSRTMLTILALGLAVWLAGAAGAAPMGTAWTYQGRLLDANVPADGLYDFQFRLFDDPNIIDGNQKVSCPYLAGSLQRDITEYVIRSGRALLYPVYKGTYERPAARGRVWTLASVMRTPLAYRDWGVLIAKDLRRSIDYLETRQDIDEERMAYYGFSWGAMLGTVMLAVEDRFETGILISGGLPPYKLPRSVDLALYAQRVTTPVMMINGTDDFLMPLETCLKPMYELLGTHEEHKKHKLYPGGHDLFRLFRKQIQEDVLDWLDHYLGAVNDRRRDEN